MEENSQEQLRSNDHAEDNKDLEEVLYPDEIQSIIDDPEIPKSKRDKIIKAFVRVISVRQASFSGPIPPPEILKGYNEVVSNGAERIVLMAENQSSHRIHLEDHAVKEQLKQSRQGQLFGFILGLIGLILATVLALLGHETIAGIFGTITIVGLVTVFVLGRNTQDKDLSEKK